MDVLHQHVGWDLVEVDELQEASDRLVQADGVVAVAGLVGAVAVLLTPHQRRLESNSNVNTRLQTCIVNRHKVKNCFTVKAKIGVLSTT